MLTYGKYTTTIKGATFVPIVGMFVGGSDTEYDIVQIKCDPADVFTEYKATRGEVGTETML